MNSGHFGDRSTSLDQMGIEGMSGVQLRLQLKGKFVAKGCGIGTIMHVTANVAGDRGGHALLGMRTRYTVLSDNRRQQSNGDWSPGE